MNETQQLLLDKLTEQVAGLFAKKPPGHEGSGLGYLFGFDTYRARYYRLGKAIKECEEAGIGPFDITVALLQPFAELGIVHPPERA